MRLVIAMIIGVLFCGCNNSQIEESLQIQQNSIDEVNSKIDTLQTKLDLQQKKIDALETQMGSLQTGVKKVTPGYLEGNIQEGN